MGRSARILGLFAFPFLTVFLALGPNALSEPPSHAGAPPGRPPSLRSASLTPAGSGELQGRRPQARHLQGDRVSNRWRSFRPTPTSASTRSISASGPDAAELGGAIATALARWLLVVVKPHLDPAAYQPGFDQFQSENGSWRVACPWRGFFDVDPMSVRLPRRGGLRRAADAQGRARPAGHPGGAARAPRAGGRADELRRLQARRRGLRCCPRPRRSATGWASTARSSSRTTSPTTWRSPTTSWRA